MESYFGKIKTKKYTPYTFTCRSFREYVEEQSLHIRHLEKTIDTLCHDIILLDNKLRMRIDNKNDIAETNTHKEKETTNT